MGDAKQRSSIKSPPRIVGVVRDGGRMVRHNTEIEELVNDTNILHSRALPDPRGSF